MTKPGYRLDRSGGLTAREREVLDLLRQGMSQVEVAAAIGVSKQRVGQILLVLIEKGVWEAPRQVSEPGGTVGK